MFWGVICQLMPGPNVLLHDSCRPVEKPWADTRFVLRLNANESEALNVSPDDTR